MFDELMAHIDARPKNFGPMKEASTHAKFTGDCGDTVEIWLRIDGGKIRKASYMSDGCGYSNACSSVAAKLSEGMTPAEAAELSGQTILDTLGPIPEDHYHCAILAAATLQSAALDYRKSPPKLSFTQKLKQLLTSKSSEKNHV